MTINTKAMKGVPVETKSGLALGKVASFDLDISTGQMVTMHVHAPGLVSGLIADELLVAWEMIIELTPQKVVVSDLIQRHGSRVFAQGAKNVISPLEGV